MVPSFSIGSYKAGERIDEYIERLEFFMLAQFGEIDAIRKKAILMTAIGEYATSTINNFTVEEKQSYNTLKAKLIDYFTPRVTDTVERHAFFNIIQELDEPIDDFVNRLRTQAIRCNFKVNVLCKAATQTAAAVHHVHDITDEFVRDRIVVGLFDNDTRARLMRERVLTLDSAIEHVRATEVANTHMKKLLESKSPNKNSLTVHANKSREPQISSNSGTSRYCKF